MFFCPRVIANVYLLRVGKKTCPPYKTANKAITLKSFYLRILRYSRTVILYSESVRAFARLKPLIPPMHWCWRYLRI